MKFSGENNHFKNREKRRENTVGTEHSPDARYERVLMGFLSSLRREGIRISAPEWLQFLSVIKKKTSSEDMVTMLEKGEFLHKIRSFAKVSLVKNKSDESIFHKVFDEYFGLSGAVYEESPSEEITDSPENEESPENGESSENERNPEIKEQLGIKDVDENLNLSEGEHDDNETVHGGSKDQHNDILRRADMTKMGGGNKKNINQESLIIHAGKEFTEKSTEERNRNMEKYSRATRYEVRPDRASTRQVIKNLRRIIIDVSSSKSGDMDKKKTAGNFARRNFRFEYKKEREKKQEIVLLIDIGGSVDEWSPLIKEVAEEMTKGISKIETYLFHNNIYGYVWEADPKDLFASNYAKKNSLIDLKKIIRKRKKVIIYGDAEMAGNELYEDYYPPSGNHDRIKKFGMKGDKSLEFIKRTSDSVVWINPIFRNEWERHDTSGTIEEIGGIISMHDLTVGGVEDAVKELMKR